MDKERVVGKEAADSEGKALEGSEAKEIRDLEKEKDKDSEVGIKECVSSAER